MHRNGRTGHGAKSVLCFWENLGTAPREKPKGVLSSLRPLFDFYDFIEDRFCLTFHS